MLKAFAKLALFQSTQQHFVAEFFYMWEEVKILSLLHARWSGDPDFSACERKWSEEILSSDVLEVPKAKSFFLSLHLLTRSFSARRSRLVIIYEDEEVSESFWKLEHGWEEFRLWWSRWGNIAVNSVRSSGYPCWSRSGCTGETRWGRDFVDWATSWWARKCSTSEKETAVQNRGEWCI